MIAKLFFVIKSPIKVGFYYFINQNYMFNCTKMYNEFLKINLHNNIALISVRIEKDK